MVWCNGTFYFKSSLGQANHLRDKLHYLEKRQAELTQEIASLLRSSARLQGKIQKGGIIDG
jgi:hypothetical protein